MRHMGQAIAGTVLAVGMVFAQPGLAMATHFDGDVVDVITDKQTYNRSEPIRVMAKYTNVGNESQLLALPSPGGLDVRVIVRRVGAVSGEPNAFYGSLTLVNQNFNAGAVEEHSSVMIAQTTIPAYTLPADLYEVDLIFNLSAATNPPTLILSARPWIVIQVK